MAPNPWTKGYELQFELLRQDELKGGVVSNRCRYVYTFV